MAKPKTLVATIPGMIADPDLEPLRRISDVDYREFEPMDERALADLCKGYDYLMLNYDVVKSVGEPFYSNANVRALKGISADITGMDWASPQLARKYGVSLQNIPHYSTESVAESILCEVLLHARQRNAAYHDELNGREPESRMGINLKGKVGGVVGLGSIGMRVADLLSAVGMDVLAWNRTKRDGGHFTHATIDRIFEEAAVICLCLKTVAAGERPTAGLVGEKLLSKCRNTIIVNLASAHLVDHDALYNHIEAGRVAGYSVERNKTLLASPLAKLASVHLPPSNAWMSEESLQTLRQTWVNNVVTAIARAPRNIYRE